MIDKFVETFREESYELLGELENQLLLLEKKPEDKEIISAVFRLMHTIKGSAAMFGFDQISSLAHQVESVLDLMREGRIKINRKLIDGTLKARDLLIKMLDTGQQFVESLEEEAKEVIDFFKDFLPQKEASTSEEAKVVLETSESLSETTYRIKFIPQKEIFLTGTKPLHILKELSELGEYTCVAYPEKIPPLKEFNPEECLTWWEIILTTAKDLNTLKDIFIFVEPKATVEITVIENFSNLILELKDKRLGEILLDKGVINEETLKNVVRSQKKIGQILVEESIVTEQELKSALEEQHHVRKLREKQENTQVSATIRVSSEKLDDLVDLVGELVTIQARLSQSVMNLENSNLTFISEQIEHLISELRDTSMSLRMLPIGTTFSKFNRLVRDLSANLGKEISMQTEGGETELDKTVIEKLNDPLVHIIRNCIDHGIETPEAREKKGKSRKGLIKLTALHSGGQVIIIIEDDGEGLNTEKIREKAIRKGILNPEAEISEEQLQQFIFMPGFSTTENVTSVSGRGVGMDVVKKEIDSLRGSVSIQSIKGKGTKVILSIPLTLAIIEGLLTKVGEDYFVLPLSSVEECVELIEKEEIRSSKRSLINIRGEALPYLRLKELFEISSPKEKIEQIVIVKARDFRLGIVVDQVLGDYQTVIKSLGKMFKKAEGISGATILGDGSLALIVDINKLSEIAVKQEQKSHG